MGAFIAWLQTIADHRLIDEIRKVDRGQCRQLSLANTNSLSELIDLVSVDLDSPSHHARRQEAFHAIQIAIAGLPDDQQEAIRLRWLQQKSLEEIARQTGRTEDAVRGLIQRGQKKALRCHGALVAVAQQQLIHEQS